MWLEFLYRSLVGWSMSSGFVHRSCYLVIALAYFALLLVAVFGHPDNGDGREVEVHSVATHPDKASEVAAELTPYQPSELSPVAESLESIEDLNGFSPTPLDVKSPTMSTAVVPDAEQSDASTNAK